MFVCCADSPSSEPVSTVAAYLRRRGFRVFLGERSATGVPDEGQLALVEAIPDFLLLLTPATVEVMGGAGHGVRAEIERALATRRNLVLVAPAGAPAPPARAFPKPLSSLAGRTTLTYDPDRLAETLSIIQHGLSSDTTVVDRHLMRRTGRLFIAAAIFVLAAASLQVVPALIRTWTRPRPQPPVAPFALYWSGFGQRAEAGGSAAFQLADDVELSGGDRLAVAFSPSADGHAYA